MAAVLCTTVFMQAQDIIYFQNGSELKAKIQEVKTEIITYKKYTNLTGPTYESLRKEVYKIKYQNGEIEIISPEDNDGKTGIGFKFTGGDTLVVTMVDKNSAASETGIMAGDKIIKINAFSKDKFSNESNVQNMLDGPVGTNIDITFIRGTQKNPFVFTLTRKLPVIEIKEPVTVFAKTDSIQATNTGTEVIKDKKPNKPGNDADEVITSSKHLVGLMVGPSITTCSYYAPPPTYNAQYAPVANYYLGFYYQYNFKPSIGIRTGLSFSGQGAAKTNGSPGDGIRLNYMDVYVGFQYTLAKPWKFQPYIHAGPIFSILLSGTEQYGGPPILLPPGALKEYNIGLTIGIGTKYNIWKKLYLSGEWQSMVSFTNVEGLDAPIGQESRVFTIGSFLFGAGWRF